MRRFLKRTIETGIKLPFAVAWDCISMGNMGDGSSTAKVLREHRRRKNFDDTVEQLESVAGILRKG